MMRFTILVSTLVLVLFSACTVQNVNSFEDCVDVGNPVLESYPRQCVHNGVTYTEQISLSEQCRIKEGTWLGEFNECEGISQEACNAMKGTYQNCASACRNQPDTKVCTLQCVQVCSFS